VPSGGIDNLALSSVDHFSIPGKGDFDVSFDGYFRVARDNPTTNDWATAQVFVNMVDMNLSGSHQDLGRINVRINPDVVSSGQTFGPGAENQAAKCRISAGVIFDFPDQRITVFNKEPILLMNDAIDSIPPVEDPNGAAHIYRLPLYSTADPNGQPVAYLNSLRYTVGSYLTQAQAASLQSR